MSARRALLAGWVTLTLGCASALPAPAPPNPDVAPPHALAWHVVFDDAFVATVRVCPAVVVAPVDPRARAFLRSERVVDGCRELVLDLGAAAAALGDRDSAARVADDVLLASPDVWLWSTRPARGGRLTLTLPAGWSALLPFPEGEGGGWDVDASTWAFLSCAAFGRLNVHDVAVVGARLHVLLLPGELAMERADVDRWLGSAAEAVATAHGGRFPFDDVVVHVEPVGGDGVPFGMVARGGGPHALLLLGARARVQDVVGDWVGVHELSHLLAPPFALDDAWLAEGLASYWQSVLRARVGLLDHDEAWRRLADGLDRGAAAAARGPSTASLGEASRTMRAEGRWLQVYWGGAAIALAMDVRLRRCADVSIDDVIASFRREQPRVDARRILARDVVARAAAVAAAGVAREPACGRLAEDVAEALARPFPDVQPLLQALGVRGPRSPCTDAAPLAALRAAIVRPGPGDARGAAGRRPRTHGVASLCRRERGPRVRFTVWRRSCFSSARCPFSPGTDGSPPRSAGARCSVSSGRSPVAPTTGSMTCTSLPSPEPRDGSASS